MLFDNFAAYAFDKKVFGKVMEYSAIKNTLTIEDADGNLHVSKDAILLKKIGELNGEEVFDGDVIQENSYKYEIQLLDNKTLEVYALDDKLNRIGTSIKIDSIKILNADGITLVGNIHELRDKLPNVDFDIKIVKSYDGAYYTYYYACNDKEKKKVDLIKATFFGDKVISDEGYQRQTITHDDYLDRVAKGVLKEVGGREFHNYILGMSLVDDLQKMNPSEAEDDDWEEDWEDDCDKVEEEW